MSYLVRCCKMHNTGKSINSLDTLSEFYIKLNTLLLIISSYKQKLLLSAQMLIFLQFVNYDDDDDDDDDNTNREITANKG